MSVIDILNSLFTDYTLRTVALGSGILGIVSGALGAFAVLRRQALLGDAISHTALPGIAIAFLITGSRAAVGLMMGAAIAGWLGTLAVMLIINRSRIKQDSALGIVLSVLFGFGLVLMTFIQRLPGAGKAGLDKFLFGQASTMMTEDVITMAIAGIITLIILALFWKEFKLLSFDQGFGASMGFPMKLIDTILITLLVIAIVNGLQAVGVVLMSAMVVAPAAAARQWTDRLSIMVILSALFGAFSGICGALISSLTERLPTGPAIVLCVSVFVLISMLFAPNRGLLYNWIREARRRRDLAIEAVLLDMFELSRQHANKAHPHSAEALRAMSYRAVGIDRTLRELRSRGWAMETAEGLWFLTGSGQAKAEDLLQNMGAVA
jgi:manganese/zinc/iron transport system permease protein